MSARVSQSSASHCLFPAGNCADRGREASPGLGVFVSAVVTSFIWSTWVWILYRRWLSQSDFSSHRTSTDPKQRPQKCIGYPSAGSTGSLTSHHHQPQLFSADPESLCQHKTNRSPGSSRNLPSSPNLLEKYRDQGQGQPGA